MKFRRLLGGAAACVLVMLIITYIGFSSKNNKVMQTVTDEEQVIRILAPDEGSVHKQALEETARNYSAIRGNKQVEIQFISQENYQKEICMRTDEGTNTDLIICENTMMPSLIDMGILEDLTAYIKGSVKSRYWQNLWTNAISDGKYYGVPFTSDPYVIFYNKDLMEKENQEVPGTWDELLSVCDRIKGLGNYGFGFAAKQPEEVTAFFMQMLYSCGGSLREVNGSAGNQVFHLLLQLKNRKQISPDTMNWSQSDLAHEFAKGHIAMMAGNASMASTLRTTRLGFEVGVAGMPSGIKEAYLLHGKNIGITKSGDIEEGKKFLDYIRKPDVANFLTKEMDTVPVLVEGEYKKKKIGPSPDLVSDYMKNGVTKGAYDSWFDISGAVAAGIYDILHERNVSIKTMGDTMQDKVRVALIDK